MKHWTEKTIISRSMYPLSLLFRVAAALRRSVYKKGRDSSKSFKVPVVVVGNIAIGGTGKTPFIIWLANYLQAHGYRPGIVSRGYRGTSEHYPLMVDADVAAAGDEPYLIKQRTGCPVVVDPKRVRAVRYLLDNTDCNLVLSDDGLQHYALARDIEIALVNDFNNGYCLPAGPLREPYKRLSDVDFIINMGNSDLNYSSFKSHLKPLQFVNVKDSSKVKSLEAFVGEDCHVVTGIAHPQRFIASLKQLGATVSPRLFSDHHAFAAKDLIFTDDKPILMTEKDAVKCQEMVGDNCWFLQVETEVESEFAKQIRRRVEQVKRSKSYTHDS